MSSYYY